MGGGGWGKGLGEWRQVQAEWRNVECGSEERESRKLLRWGAVLALLSSSLA